VAVAQTIAQRQEGPLDGAQLRLELFVDDLHRSVAFYSDVLRFQVRQRQPGYVAMYRGNIHLGLGLASTLPSGHHFSPEALRGHKGTGVEVVIEVEDIASEYAHVRAIGHPIAELLGDRPWGKRDFRVVDPDGYYLRVTS
jgi:catechol 2,3-dioxygenase-like lactoylglutathione lyase family enzyme